MKVDLYDKTGKKTTKKTDLSDEIWKVPLNKDLVAQAVYIYLHNQRKGTAHSKTRAEVRGGGKKPWRQKGTGRARHGSIRSPLWVGGGVAFGPRSHKSLKRMPKKMQHAALSGLLSEKVREGKVRVLEGFSIPSAKTKKMEELLKKLGILGEKSVIIMTFDDKQNENVVQSSKNIKGLGVRHAMDVHVYDVIHADELILVPSSVKKLEERLT